MPDFQGIESWIPSRATDRRLEAIAFDISEESITA